MGSELESANEISDIFDSSLNLEDTHYREGYKEGYEDGLLSGKKEDHQAGIKVGFEIGEELGFYRGGIDVWNSAIQIDPTWCSARVQKSIKTMQLLLEKFPMMDSENENAQEMMDGLRLKYRAICAGLGLKLDYKGYPKSSKQESWAF